jgi:hypothetical protein
MHPERSATRLELACFFVEKGNAAEAMKLSRSSSNTSDQGWRALLTRLLAAKRFTEAYEVWSASHEAGRGKPQSGINSIIN